MSRSYTWHVHVSLLQQRHTHTHTHTHTDTHTHTHTHTRAWLSTLVLALENTPFKHFTNGPVARNIKQIAHDVTSGSLPNVWIPLEKALIISLDWFTELFIPFVHMQWKTRTLHVFQRRKLIASYLSHGEWQASRIKKPIIGQQNGKRVHLSEENIAKAVGNVLLHVTHRLILAHSRSKPCMLSSKNMNVENQSLSQATPFVICQVTV